MRGTEWWILAPMRVSCCMQLVSLCSRDCSLTVCFQDAKYLPAACTASLL